MTTAQIESLKLPTGCRIAEDSALQPVVLFPTTWTLDYFRKQNPEVELYDLSADSRIIAPAVDA
jgi:peptide subunit release factor RF-3